MIFVCVQEEKKAHLKGSVTVYMALCLLIMLSLVLTLLEGARVRGAKLDAHLAAQAGADSVFAEYQRELLDIYDIFGLDASYGASNFDICVPADRMEKFITDNLSGQQDAVSLFPQVLSGVEISSYELLTDESGALFYDQTVNYMESSAAAEALTSLLKKASQKSEEYDEEARSASEEAEKARESLNDESSYVSEDESEVTEEEKEAAEAVTDEQKGIIDTVKAMKDKGVLALVGVENVSEKKTDLSEILSHRELQVGDNTGTKNSYSVTKSAFQRALFQAYMSEKLSDYVSDKGNTALDYELEYCFAGCASDRENLAKTVEALLIMREGFNFAYLCTDEEKLNEARIIAIAIAGVLALPSLIAAIQYGIIAAWAFKDSVEDVKTLLSGGKVSLIKNSLSDEDAIKLDYTLYVQLLLALKERNTLVMRTMDMVEQDIRTYDYCSNFMLDHVIGGASWEADFTGGDVFVNVFKDMGAFSSEYTAQGSFYYQ